MGHSGKPSNRIAFALTALAAVALAALSMGLLDAGFIDALGNLARAIAQAAGMEKTGAKAVEIGVEAAARIAKLLLF